MVMFLSRLSFFKLDTWRDSLDSIHDAGYFSILHLNIYSIFNKFKHVFDLLNGLDFDIIALNEIKLDDSVPDKLYEHYKYNLKRRNRDSRGGGLMIYIQKCYKILDYTSSADYELISCKLLVNKLPYQFIFTYKPPNTHHDAYLDFMDTFLKSKNLNEQMLIIGDLNMDMLSSKGAHLRDFCDEFGLVNFVKEPTRVVYGKSSTLIDVVLHNGTCIESTHVVDFPYSDHKMVITKCKFKSVVNPHIISTKRKLNEKAIQAICGCLAAIDFSFLESVRDPENRCFFFKKIILDEVN
jgi:hypothetical protein